MGEEEILLENLQNCDTDNIRNIGSKSMMGGKWRKFKVLMWKHAIVRVRRFIHTPIELLAPIALFIVLVTVAKSALQNGKRVVTENDLEYEPVTVSKLVYTPVNEFTDKLMSKVNERFVEDSRTVDVQKCSNETELEQIKTKLTYGHAVIELQETFDAPTLSYTIHAALYDLKRTPFDYDYDGTKTPTFAGGGTRLVSHLQWVLDTSFIEIKSGTKVTQRMHTRQFPFKRTIDSNMRLCALLLKIVCSISLFLGFVFLMSRLLEERSTGIKELVQMAGVSSHLLEISHLCNVLPAGLIYSFVGTLLLKTGSKPLLPNSDEMLIIFNLILHYISIIAATFPCSYILQGSNFPTSVSLFAYIALNVPAFLVTTFVRDPAGQAAGGLLPHAPMFWLWTEVAEFEQYDEGLTFSEAFKSHTPASGPVALGIFLMILQSLIFFALAWYLSHVRPGKYGQALPWNFLFQKRYWKKEEVKPVWAIDDEITVTKEMKYFEEPANNLDVGIKIDNVSKIYPQQKALSNVSLNVYKGEITVLLGHNGAGKTTLMSIITGMTSASEGRVLVNGVDTSRAGDELRSQLGLCPQHNLFFADLTVLQHAMFFTLIKSGTFQEARRKSYELLETLGLRDKADDRGNTLSGGMLRRLQLACALAGDASVLVLDEPTSGLDVETRRELWDLLLSLRGNRTVLLTTHFMEEADALGDRVAALHHGQLRCHATPMYLKKAIGTGYRLTFTTKGLPNEAAVTSAVTSHVSEATNREKTINSLSYNLPSSATKNFPKLFSSLESNKTKLGIESIGVGVSTLEEVFLKLCSDTCSTFDEDEVDTIRTEPTCTKVTGVPLYLRQLWILLMRQFKYIWNKKMSFLIMQVLIPIILISVITYFMNKPNSEVRTPIENPGRIPIDLDFYKDAVTPRRVLRDVIGGDERAFRDSWPDVEFQESKDIIEVVRSASRTEYDTYIAGIQINDIEATALVPTTIRLTMPVATNLLSNAIATRYMPQATGRTFRAFLQPVVNHNFGYDYYSHNNRSQSEIIMYSMVLVFITLASMINNVTLPCAERASGARHIHMMSGCPAVLHWAATCIFHIGLCFLFLIVTVAVSAAAVDNTVFTSDAVGAMVLVLTLASLAFLAFMYFVSSCFEARGAHITLFAVLFIFGMITVSFEIGVLFDDAPKSKTTEFFLGVFSFLMPPHASTLAFLKTVALANANKGLAAAQTSTICYICMSTSNDVVDKFNMGQELIFLAIQFAVYMTLVILIQEGVINKLADKIVNGSHRSPSRKIQYLDETVGAEANYIEKQIALPRRQLLDSEQAMLTRNLYKNYFNIFSRSCTAVKGVSLSVKKGECFGLLGVNGAGKSTTFKMLTAEECLTDGDIYANGYFRNERGPYLRSLGYCPQFFGLDDFLTGRENLTLLLTLRGLNTSDVAREVESWIEVVGLEKYSDRRVSAYSGGCKRRLAAAAALSSGAPLTLLDEPTAGVDVSARRLVWKALLHGLRQGRAVIITSHSMDEMEALCSRIAIMSDGAVRALGTPSELRARHAAGHAVVFKLTSNVHDTSVDGSTRARLALEEFKNAMSNRFNCTLKDEHKTMLHYHINETMQYSDVFRALESLKNNYANILEDYSITETTLEEVFLSLAREQNNKAHGGNIA